jgi:hypothetical protein
MISFSSLFFVITACWMSSCVGQICSDADTLSLNDGTTTIFKVDKVNRTTTVKNLKADACECGGVDVKALVEKVELMSAELAALRNATLAPTLDVVAVKSVAMAATARQSVTTPNCPSGYKAVSCTAEKQPHCHLSASSQLGMPWWKLGAGELLRCAISIFETNDAVDSVSCTCSCQFSSLIFTAAGSCTVYCAKVGG